MKRVAIGGLYGAGLAAALLAAGCATGGAGPAGGGEPVGEIKLSILKGAGDVDTPPANATVAIVNPNGGLCSGSLLTSTVAISAAHCDIRQGDTVWIGPEHPAPTFPPPGGTKARARRVVIGVDNLIAPSALANNDYAMKDRARDVALVRFRPPMTMAASPVKPTLVRPPLLPSVVGDLAVFPGGIAGYGLLWIYPSAGPQLILPGRRQVASSQEFTVFHRDLDGWGVWWRSVSAKASASAPSGAKGDSGGPLFRKAEPPGSEVRDVIGVLSTVGTWNASPCPDIICGATTNHTHWADLTAPKMKAWILSRLDPSGDGRWEGEVDYVRRQFGTPGCDVAASPGCDPGCDPADWDCDLVTNLRDSCPRDYNPDQRNSDDPFDWDDPQNRIDPGDACDLCVGLPGPHGNCNADAEIARFGPRPRLREDHVISNPLNPGALPHPMVVDNEQRYRGDRCDATPCMQLAGKRVVLDPAVYGAPDPLTPGCLAPFHTGGSCAWVATAEFERDGRIAELLDGVSGATAYRFCPCPGPFLTQEERIANCLQPAGPCPLAAADLTTSANVHEIDVTPSFASLAQVSPPEEGTEGDKFTVAPKTVPASFRWQFEKDLPAITGQSLALPLTPAAAASVKLDGLLWSNVRRAPFLNASQGRPDLASYWLPVQLRVRAERVGGKRRFVIPAGWLECEMDPNCGFGLVKPWINVVQPAVDQGLRVLGVAPGRSFDLTALFSEEARALLADALAAGSAVIVPAAEHASVLAARPGAVPRLAMVDLAGPRFLGALGRPAGGPMGPIAAPEEVAGGGPGSTIEPSDSDAPLAAVAPAGDGGSAAPALATLAATRAAVYLLDRSAGASRLLRYDLGEGAWTETSLSVSIDAPLALVFNAADGTLYALGAQQRRRHRRLRLFGIRDDGSVRALAEMRVGEREEVFLSAAEDGSLLLARSRTGTHVIDRFTVRAGRARATGSVRGEGDLAAAPRLDARGLHLAVAMDAGASVEPRTIAAGPLFGRPAVGQVWSGGLDPDRAPEE